MPDSPTNAGFGRFPPLLDDNEVGVVAFDLIVGPRGVQQAVNAVVAAGHRVSDTPDAPILLKLRPGADPAPYEIADGHHRVAAAMLRGATAIRAQLRREYDDEPYDDPQLLSDALSRRSHAEV